jgi:hypothetical protein
MKQHNLPYPSAMNEQFNMLLNKDLAKHYKHIKSNSEAVTNQFNHFEDSKADVGHYENQRRLVVNQISPEKPVLVSQGAHEENMVILSNNFNTVKYSQSPFLNKLTSLKAKKKQGPENYKSGHKSRNSMCPKSYTYQRREPEIYNNMMRQKSFGQIPEEGTNPYTNINPYENEEKADFIIKE